MESGRTNIFDTKEVLACCNAWGDGESRISLVNKEMVRSPLVSCRVIAILPNLEPLEAYTFVEIELFDSRECNIPVTEVCVAEGIAALKTQYVME